MTFKKAFVGVVGTSALVGGMLTGTGPAQGATGDCEDNVGYRISERPVYRENGGNTLVIGLSRTTRTVTFRVVEESACELESGDKWSVHSPYFHAEGTYDGTAASLTDSVRVAVPNSDSEAGDGSATVTLEDVTGSDNDFSFAQALTLKRRTEWRNFNVFYESPVPKCRPLNGSSMGARGQLFRASWTADKYRPYAGRSVRLLRNPGGPFGPGHTADDLADITIDTGVTDSQGWGRFVFNPPFDATYVAHYGGNGVSAHFDSAPDFVNCNN